MSRKHQRLDKRAATQGFGWMMAFNFINKFVLPLATLYMARVLGPETIGVYAAIYAVFMASEVLRDGGLAQTYMRDQEVDSRKEGSYMALGIAQGLLPAAIVFALREPIGAYFRSPLVTHYLGWACIGLAFDGFGTIPRAKVLRSGRVKESGMREMIANVIALAVALGMVFMGYGLEALLTMLVLNCILNVTISYGLAPVASFRPDVKLMRGILRAASSTFGANLLYNIYFLSDHFVVGRLLDKAALGMFNRAKSVAQLPMQLFSVPMMRPLQVAFSQNSQDAARIGNILGRALGAATMFAVPAFALLAIAAEPLVKLLLGSAWLPAIPVVQVLCVYFGSRTIGTISGTALVAGGRARLTMISWLAAFIVAAIAIVILPNTLTFITAAYALGAVTVYALHTLFALRTFPLDEAAALRLRSGAMAGACSAVALLAMYFIPLDPWLRVGIALAVTVALHLSLLGWLMAGNIRAYASMRGVRALYEGL